MHVYLSSAPIDVIGIHLFTLQVPRWIMQDWAVFDFFFFSLQVSTFTSRTPSAIIREVAVDVVDVLHSRFA